jgi:hypothetical protein
VKDSLKSLYSFCSDYAGVRHGGRPMACNRVLDEKDCVLTCLLLLSFSGYLTNGVDTQEILGSWPGTAKKRRKMVSIPQASTPIVVRPWLSKLKSLFGRT